MLGNKGRMGCRGRQEGRGSESESGEAPFGRRAGALGFRDRGRLSRDLQVETLQVLNNAVIAPTGKRSESEYSNTWDVRESDQGTSRLNAPKSAGPPHRGLGRYRCP